MGAIIINTGMMVGHLVIHYIHLKHHMTMRILRFACELCFKPCHFLIYYIFTVL